MKKLLLSMLFLAAGIASSSATDYNLTIAGVKVTSSNASNVTGGGIKSGTVSYDAGTNTLTLKGTQIETTTYGIYCGIDGLKIVIDGWVEVKSTEAHGMGVVENTTIVGNDFNASFWVYGAESGSWSAIWVMKSATLTLKNLWAYVRGGYKALNGYYYRDNVEYRGTLDLNCCYLSVSQTSDASTGSCVSGFKEINTWGVTYDYNGYDYSTSSYKLVTSSGSNAKSHTIQPRLAVGKYIFNPRYDISLNSSSTGSGIKSGTVKWSASNKELTLSKAVIEAPNSFKGIGYYGLADAGEVDIWIDDANSIQTKSGGACIYSYNRNLEIGGQSVGVGDKLTLTAEGTHALDIEGNKKLKLDGAEFVIKGKNNGIFGNNNSTLEINKCKITSESVGEYCGISGFSSCTLTNCCVNTGETPVLFDESVGAFTDISGTYAKMVAIGIPTKTYRTDVCGVAINDLTKDNVIVPGLTKGKISYTPGANDYEGTLKLNGVTLASTVANQAVFRPGMNAQDKVTITISGDNYLSGGHSTLYPGGSLTINGSGNLYCDATGSNFGAFYQTGGNVTSTIAVDGVVKFEKGKYGYYVGYSTSPNDKLILKKNGNSDYYFIGTSCAINSTSLVLDGMDFYGKSSEGGFPGCYFDETAKCVKQNGGVTATGANFYQVHTEYDIKILGTKLNNCTVHGFGSKCITAGGPTAVTYDSKNKILTLNGATIKQESSVSAVDNAYPGIDGLTINVEGTNSLIDAGGYPLYLGTNTTVTGSGSLEVSKFWGFNGTITLKDINAKFKGNLPASNAGKLVVDLTTAGKKVEVMNYVYGWDMVSAINGTKMWGADDQEVYFDTSEKYIVYNDGTHAKHVIFTDKTATTDIDAIEVANDTEVKQIYDATGRESNTAKSGLNIIRMSDGTVRKVMVK